VKDFLNKKEIQIPENLQENEPIVQEEEAEYKEINNEEVKEESKNLEKNKKYIALTFDDGPSKANTPILLDILKKNNTRATFFVL
jgi:peptidoglycan/xylan/chitin deacetylase (PgdA/CDA1 family)